MELTQGRVVVKHTDQARDRLPPDLDFRAFDRAEFPWQETRQVIFDTWQRKGDVNIEIGFPVQIAESK